MSEPITFTKLINLVDSIFKIEKVHEPKFKLYDTETNKMLTSDTFQPGYRKVYPTDTDKGRLDLGSGQLGNLLEAVFMNGKADLNGKSFKVKSNGKTGLDIRYFFDAVKEQAEPERNEFTYE